MDSLRLHFLPNAWLIAADFEEVLNISTLTTLMLRLMLRLVHRAVETFQISVQQFNALPPEHLWVTLSRYLQVFLKHVVVSVCLLFFFLHNTVSYGVNMLRTVTVNTFLITGL